MPRGRELELTDTVESTDRIVAITPTGLGAYETVIAPAASAGNAPGARGPKGDKGPDGVNGHVGVDGAKGPTGPAGAKGPTGPAGAAGIAGPAGANGADGSNYPESTFTDTEDMDCFASYAVGATTFDKGIGWNGYWVTTNTTARQCTLLDGRKVIRAEIAGGQMGRIMSWGNSWNVLRISMLVRVNANAANFDTEWAVGLCSGTANMFASAACVQFLGLYGPATNTFTLNAGTNCDYYTHEASHCATKIGAVITDYGANAGATGRAWMAEEHGQNFVHLVFTRGNWPTPYSGTVDIAYASPTGAWSQYRSTKGWNNVRMAVRRWNMPTLWGDTTEGNAGCPLDDTTGALDTFCIYWPDATHPLQIAAVDICKLQ